MPQTLGTDRPSIAVRAVTAWDGGQGTVFDPDTLAVRQGPERAFDALRRDAPVWIDMDLESRSTTDWLEPWDAPAAGIVDWSDLRGLASRLGFPLPCSAESDDPVAVALERLPTLNELAVLRWLGQRLDPLDMDYAFAPLVGCIPTFQLTDVDRQPMIDLDPQRTGPLELVLLRVNLVVIGRFMFTVRLPDRLCTGGPLHKEAARIFAEVRVPREKRPNLTVFSHHLPHRGRPTPREVGDALALYLSATCWSAAEHARARLIEIERVSYQLARGDALDTDVVKLGSDLAETAFEVIETLQVAAHELVRGVDRLSEASGRQTHLPTQLGARYERSLKELRAVQRDAQMIIDALSGRAARYQQNVARHRERRQDRLQVLLVSVGVIPPLVATMFADEVKVGGSGDSSARLGMALVMLGSVLLGLSVVLVAVGPPLSRGRSRILVVLALAALFVCGVGVRAFVS